MNPQTLHISFLNKEGLHSFSYLYNTFIDIFCGFVGLSESQNGTWKELIWFMTGSYHIEDLIEERERERERKKERENVCI